ncbi:MAG TPA: ATP-binding protein [Verrucomicrobiota bacterium]|nr:ATP-binding protein [Verrucomicrobiota bacterium]HRT56824.1 ATP-binding protein [Candidatus Paceibacterota bacterium]
MPPMLWPILTLLAVAALVALHLGWRARHRAALREAERRLSTWSQASQERESELQARQEALLNSMVEGLLLLDEDGRVELANRALVKLLDLPGDPRGKSLIETVRAHELAGLVKSLSPQQPLLDYQLRLAGSPEKWLQVNGAAWLDNQGRPRGTVLVFHDLTRLKKLERNREEFVANVSHELRTPLSMIKGYVETLLEGAKDNPEVATRFLETINRNADRLKLLIEDLLTISELESGRVRLNLQPVALRGAADKVLGDFKARAGAKEIKLTNAVPDLPVRADLNRLEQVLGNLVDNAIKYGRPGGWVEVSARPANPGLVEICVRDNGPGIPPEALERIFERFYRVDKARSREQGGTGLGLSIVKHIVQSHGGTAWARSEPGQGASFFFTMPEA